MNKIMILIGSPKVKYETSSSHFISNAIKSGISGECEVRIISRETPESIIADMPKFDLILLVTPNYIHSVPAPVLNFMYALPKTSQKQKFGVIIQAGFMNADDSQYVCRYLETLIPSLGYDFIGLIPTGECAGYGWVSSMFKSIIPIYAEVGSRLEKQGILDAAYLRNNKLISPDTISAEEERRCNRMNRFGLGNMFWNLMLLKHKAFTRRKAHPFDS